MPRDFETTETVENIIQQNVLLLAPTFHRWEGMYMLPRDHTVVAVDGENADLSQLTVPRVKLLTNAYPLDSTGMPWKKRLDGINSRYSAVISRYSLPFPIHGVRIIPKSSGVKFMQEIFGTFTNGVPHYQADATQQSVYYELVRARNEFAVNFADILEQIREHSDKHVWDHIFKRIPDAKSIANKFHIDVVPVEIQNAGKAQVLDESVLAQYDSIVREACRQKVGEALDEMIAGPRDELATAIEALQELLAREGSRVTTRSFEPIRRAIEKIRAFEFVANRELLDHVRDLEDRVEQLDPADIRQSPAARETLMTAVSAVLGEAVNEASRREVRRTLSFGRVLPRARIAN